MGSPRQRDGTSGTRPVRTRRPPSTRPQSSSPAQPRPRKAPGPHATPPWAVQETAPVPGRAEPPADALASSPRNTSILEVLRRPVEFAQYTSAEFSRFCKDNQIRRSVGRTGVCWDNAAAESFFASLKNDMYYRYIFPTRARARFAVADYIEVFYNRRRLHSTLGYRTPNEALNEFRTAAAAA
jgi:hypothetical protein